MNRLKPLRGGLSKEDLNSIAKGLLYVIIQELINHVYYGTGIYDIK